jgi:hypothetical protein
MSDKLTWFLIGGAVVAGGFYIAIKRRCRGCGAFHATGDDGGYEHEDLDDGNGDDDPRAGAFGSALASFSSLLSPPKASGGACCEGCAS